MKLHFFIKKNYGFNKLTLLQLTQYIILLIQYGNINLLKNKKSQIIIKYSEHFINNMQMQQPIKNNNKPTDSKTIHEKGLLLAKLLQKKVQQKMNNKGSTTPKLIQSQNMKKNNNQSFPNQNKESSISQSNKNISLNMSHDQQGSQNLLTQINQQLKQLKQQKSSVNKKSNNSLLKSKITTYEEHDFSFDDSMSMQPSYITFQGQQISQMLKFIYVQLFGQQKYELDKKRYQQIQSNPLQQRLQQGQQFNKQGKMLQNICYQIRSLKINVKNLTSQIKKLQAKDLQLTKMLQMHKEVIQKQKQQENKSKELPKQQIVERNGISSQQLERENHVLHLSIKQLEEQNFVLQQTIKKLQKQYDYHIKITQNQGFKTQKRLVELQSIINLRDKEIDHLLMNIGQLQIQLNQIKQEIQAKQSQGIFQPTMKTPKNNKSNSPEKYDSLQMLSTIKQEQQPKITDFVYENCFKLQKQVQTEHNQPAKSKPSAQIQNLIKKTDEHPTQLQRIILQLKKVLAHKEKVLLTYQKQIQTHQSQVQKYQGFISQLGSQIQICQHKLAQNNKKSQQMINRKIQTDQKYFLLLYDGKDHSNYNNQLTSGQREDEFLMNNTYQKQPSIAEEVDNKQKLKQNKFQIKDQITFRKVTDKKINIERNQHMERQNINKQQRNTGNNKKPQKFWDQVSVTLSQFSQTQQLRDIRNLTKQLSQAYDKIISLTYQVNNLKSLTANKQFCSQQTQENSNQQNIKMIKQK